MPYITKEKRGVLNNTPIPSDPGELNYCIHKLIFNYINKKKLCYNTLNDVMGVLGCVAQEIYRRLAIPYEDKKINQNGDLEEYLVGFGGLGE